jgi:ribulose-phosphate 3-epimerase
MPKIKIAPSMLSADKSKINSEIKQVEEYSDLLHVDIMDGIFVPPTTIDAAFVSKIKSKLPFDVHLMVHEPSFSYIQGFIDAGAASITIHVEGCKDPMKQIEYIKSKKVKTAISIKPKTSIDAIKKYLDHVNMVLVMTVEPGWGGQSFIPEMMEKVRELRALKPKMDIEVDGGINHMTAAIAKAAGANVFVAGNYIFGDKDRVGACKRLISALKQ